MTDREGSAPGVVDEYGFDPAFRDRVQPVVERVARRVFRAGLVIEGAADWKGPVVFVANHGGFLPIDAIVTKALLDPHIEGAGVRPLLEDYTFTLPWVGLWATRLGCVRASQENAVRLLSRGEPVLAFPEGVKGAYRTLFERGRVMRFGRGGLVRLALRTRTQVVPVGIAGPDEAYPVFARLEKPARFVGLPFLPLSPTFPVLGPLGLLPLPARITVVVGDPVDLHEIAGTATPDEACILRVNEFVRGRVAELVGRARSARPPAAGRAAGRA
ncbi:MAG: 1-acyl-sn-glycerol-3-phosphate acyltransferase [Deltaproteobacteria bacterium]|nr:1-acyl-sn-glycerol-3-phosphate acyltransferase [Deltaproteobacteria bacterium]